jgi:hypothetical protein
LSKVANTLYTQELLLLIKLWLRRAAWPTEMNDGIQPNNGRPHADLNLSALEMWKAFHATPGPSHCELNQALLKDILDCSKEADAAEKRLDFNAAVSARKKQVQIATQALNAESPLLLQAKIQLGRAYLRNNQMTDATEVLAAPLVATTHLPTDGNELLHHLAQASLRELLQAHLERRDFPSLLANLSIAATYMTHLKGVGSEDCVELAFERVLALEAVRASSEEPTVSQTQEIRSAIVEARDILLSEECRVRAPRKAELLHALSLKLFNSCAWDEAEITLQRSLSFVTDLPKRSACILMLAQIAAYRGQTSEAHAYLALLEQQGIDSCPARKLLAQQICSILAPRETISLPQGGLATDSPILRCIKDSLVRGYVLLQSGEPLAAQGLLEGAGALISHHYNSRHVLWSTTHMLLCKTFAERANRELERDPPNDSAWKRLLTVARGHALQSYDIQRELEGTVAGRQQALTFALSITEALEETGTAATLRAMLQRERL